MLTKQLFVSTQNMPNSKNIAKYLQLPEDTSGVSVIIMTKRDIFYSRAAGQKAFDVFEKPRLVVVANRIKLRTQKCWSHEQRASSNSSCSLLPHHVSHFSMPEHSCRLSGLWRPVSP
jgi:hypothetical protein